MEDSLYRISVKALIQNEAGETLVVRTGDDRGWTLPGGGLDHGEDVREGLQREVREELGTSQLEVGRTPVLLHSSLAKEGKRKGLWCMWPVYEAKINPDDIDLDNAPDGVAHGFVSLKELDLHDVQLNERPLFTELRQLGL